MESERNYWSGAARARLSRRTVLRGAGLGLSGLAGAALIGCGSDDSPGTTPGPTGAGTTAPSQGGSTATAVPETQFTDATFTSAIGSDIGSGDPQSLGGTGGGNWPNTDTHWGYGGLMMTDNETRVMVPNLAESVEVGPDNMSYTYKLRQDVFFHNGDPVTAEDVKFSMDRGALGQATYNPEYVGGHRGQFAATVERAEVIDDHTVQFVMQQPDVIFLRRALFLVPKEHIERVGDVAFAESPIGTGMFKFVSRTPDSEIVSERWEKFHIPFGSPSGVHPPHVSRLVQKVIPEAQSRLAALQAGEVDLIHNVSSDIARQLDTDSKYKVNYLAGTQPMHIHINAALPNDPRTGEANPWQDVRVRRAANLAVDLDGIIASILTGREQPSYGSASTGFGFPTDIQEKRFGYDPAEARRLLDAAGFGAGIRDQIVYNPIGRWPNSREVSEVIAQQLTEVGITTRIQEIQYQEVTTRFKDRSLYPLSFWGMSGGDDPGANFRFGYHPNGDYTMSPASAEVATLIERSEGEFDPEARADLLAQIVTKFYEDASWIFLHEPVTVSVTTDAWDWDVFGRALSNPEYWRMRPSA